MLKEAAKDEKYIESIADDIEKLIQKVHSDKAVDLQKNREDITGFIKSELLTRYYYEKGRIEGMLNNDDEVKAAIEILSDKDRYNNILTHGK